MFDTIQPESTVYDYATWVVIILISLVFLLYTYLSLRLAHLTQQRRWKWIFRGFAVVCFVFAAIRLSIVLWYYDNAAAKVAFPLTGLFSWVVIACAGIAIVQFVEGVKRRASLSVAGIDLMNEIQENVVKVVLNGNTPTPGVIRHYHQKSEALAARV